MWCRTPSRGLATLAWHGVLDNPAAWIMRAARNRAWTAVRREKSFRDKEPEIIRLMDNEGASPEAVLLTEQEITDDRLRLMFVCSHLSVSAEAQVALALKTLCGFSVTEISRAFLTSAAAIAEAPDVRAKQKNSRGSNCVRNTPPAANCPRGWMACCNRFTCFLMKDTRPRNGDRLVREELCHEAIRLTALLAAHPAPATGPEPMPPRADADERLPASPPAWMTKAICCPCLKEQDRTRWGSIS